MPDAPQPLSSVAVGTTATVAEIKLPPESRPRLMEMGLLVGSVVDGRLNLGDFTGGRSGCSGR